MTDSFLQRCINDTLQGLRDGLSHFSGPSHAAVIFSLPGQNHLSIYDPDSLLRGHELKIKHFYYDQDNISVFPASNRKSGCYSHIESVPDLQLDGLLSFGGSSATVPYQMWFSEHHPDLTSTGPTIRWLEHTVLRFSHDIANEAKLYTGISGKFLKEYSTHAIHDHIVRKNLDYTKKKSNLDVYHILEAILGISKTSEEGALPSGKLVFVEPEEIASIDFLAAFDENDLPRIDHYKHVRKLLQTVEDSNHRLISDGSRIFGIAGNRLSQNSLTAEYHCRYGYLRLNNETVCSFSDGKYKSSSLRAKLFEVEEALLDFDLHMDIRDKLFHIVSTLVHRAQFMKHGCTFILDINDRPASVSGQLLKRPLNLNIPELLELACAFSRVDGALHIYKDQHLYRFACILDGHSITGEDRARGARYNSALRFTAENPATIVIVVSSDRPVSVIQNGIVYHGQCQWRSITNCKLAPESLEEWLKVSEF